MTEAVDVIYKIRETALLLQLMCLLGLGSALLLNYPTVLKLYSRHPGGVSCQTFLARVAYQFRPFRGVHTHV